MLETPQQALWARISQISQSIIASSSTSQSSYPTPRAPPPAFVVPSLNVTLAADFTEFFHSAGLSHQALTEASGRVLKAARDLQTLHSTNYQRVCKQYLQLNAQTLDSESAQHTVRLAAIRRKYEAEFQQQITRMQAQCLATCQRVRESKESRLEPKRTPFNAEYTPLLEKYFEYNAFPSTRDREWLARKSMMTARQIEVWFQNHRRRARKEGRPPKKLPMDQVPIELSLESLEQSMAPFMYDRSPSVDRFPTPPPEQTPVPITCAPPAPAMPWRIEHFTILDSTDAPPHAFPATFADSSKLAVDPFPCKQGAFIFPAPVWAPKSIPRPHTQTCSITDLCSAFNTLRIYGPASPSSPSPEPWYASRCTGPLAAPHPSLIRPQPIPSPSTPARSRRSPTPQTKPKKKRRPSTQDSRRLPSTLPSKSLSRMSSSSSLSSSSDIETPESSPAQSRAMSLPFVYGVDDHTYMHGSPPPLVFDMYAKHPPQNQHLQLPLWSIPHSLST